MHNCYVSGLLQTCSKLPTLTTWKKCHFFTSGGPRRPTFTNKLMDHFFYNFIFFYFPENYQDYIILGEFIPLEIMRLWNQRCFLFHSLCIYWVFVTIDLAKSINCKLIFYLKYRFAYDNACSKINRMYFFLLYLLLLVHVDSIFAYCWIWLLG